MFRAAAFDDDDGGGSATGLTEGRNVLAHTTWRLFYVCARRGCSNWNSQKEERREREIAVVADEQCGCSGSGAGGGGSSATEEDSADLLWSYTEAMCSSSASRSRMSLPE